MNERIKAGTSWVTNLLILGLAAILLAAVAVPREARAEACATYDEVMGYFAAAREAAPTAPLPVPLNPAELAHVIEGAKALGLSGAERATRGFRLYPSAVPGAMAFGLEVDGCLLPPFYGAVGGGAPSPRLDSEAIRA